ncbi:MAG: hypothetical protein Q4B60_09530 [Erysipelotrichaceae bacterium]|nr:hypothetical protein [Erysipelotrichaceae bacterium]
MEVLDFIEIITFAALLISVGYAAGKFSEKVNAHINKNNRRN